MYIDPNTGGMLFQILAVMFGVVSAIILLFSSKIRIALARLRRRMRHRNETETEKTFSDEVTPPPAA